LVNPHKAPDVGTFLSLSGLPANVPTLTLVPGQKDPLIVDGGRTRGHQDIEWAGAVAKNATIIFVYSTNVFWFARLCDSASPRSVISISYGWLRTHILHFGIQWLVAMAQQAKRRKASPLVAASGTEAPRTAMETWGNFPAVLGLNATCQPACRT